MKIYTRTGDCGSTGLYGGGRVLKSHARIAACGAVDEVNACLGVCRTPPLPADVDGLIGQLQHDMFALGAELASPAATALAAVLLDEGDVTRIEAAIDRYDEALPPLQTFVLPGGGPASASLHLARAVCRRAEREVVALSQSEQIRPLVVVYLNRVGDLLFVLARYANHVAGVCDIPWIKKDSQ